MKRIGLALIFSLVVFTTGCNSWERTTFKTLSASKAVIDTAQADYEIGTKIPHNQAAYATINEAKAIQTAAVNSFQLAHGVTLAVGSTQDDITKAELATDTIVAQLPPLIVSVKALYGGK
jgi:hypothetical protein